MSEYQYYEFLAIDRPLSKKEIDAVSQFSTRADISSTHFVNEYHWGDFRGSPEKFLREWFDAMLYLANWGTHRFMYRVPATLIDLDYATACCVGDAATMQIAKDHVLLDFTSEDEAGNYEDDEAGTSRMASIVRIRAELIAGDNRPLYLAWLLCAQSGELDDDVLEPAVPPGLKTLSSAQIAFTDFLRLDEDLLATAAAVSGSREKSPEGFADWLCQLPSAEKDALLLSLVNGDDPHAVGRLRRQFTSLKTSDKGRKVELPRNVAQLLASTEKVRVEREAHERELAQIAGAKKEAAKKAARDSYLDALEKREEQTWGKVDVLIASKQSKGYDESVSLLRDLRDLADRHGSKSKFAANLQHIIDRHIKKPSLIQRIHKAGLTSDVK